MIQDLCGSRHQRAGDPVLYMPDTSSFADWSEAATAFQAFASAAVARYAPLGVHYWEMFNEPNLTGYGWLPAAEVAADNLKGYLMLLAAGNVAVRANDPLGLEIIGGLAADDARGVTAETFHVAVLQPRREELLRHHGLPPYGYQGTFDTAKTRIAAILTAGRIPSLSGSTNMAGPATTR